MTFHPKISNLPLVLMYVFTFYIGVKDNSGMRFVVTEELRQYDAGIMELGLIYTDKMAIPPNEIKFPLHGYCLPQCSAVVSIILTVQINEYVFYSNTFLGISTGRNNYFWIPITYSWYRS